jgi:hypothetical protein
MRPREHPKRRFTLLDAMILVAASAIALAAYRAMQPEVRERDEPIVGSWALLTSLSLAILFLRLKPPRPVVRRLMSRPGDAACAASLLATASTGFLYLVVFINWKLFSSSGIGPSDAPIICVLANGPAVMATWFIMALGRRWRPERDWIGLLGRALAVGWVLVFFAAGMLL